MGSTGKWESQTNDRKYLGCILHYVKTGIVQEFVICQQSAFSFQLLRRNQGPFGPLFMGIMMKVLTPIEPKCHCRGLCNDGCNFFWFQYKSNLKQITKIYIKSKVKFFQHKKSISISLHYKKSILISLHYKKSISISLHCKKSKFICRCFCRSTLLGMGENAVNKKCSSLIK